jgi:glycerate 2-kinase
MSRIVVAPDSFKGSCAAAAAAAAIASGWRSVRPHDEVELAPMADGGEGTLDAFAAAYPDAARRAIIVRGPDDEPVDTEWLLLADGRAVVELAATSGLTLLDPLRPDTAHTVGFGQAIAAALDAGATGLLLGIGGSSSTDGGLGALLELGLRTTPQGLRERAPGGDGLDLVTAVDRTRLRDLPSHGVVVLTDVTSPLLGPSGAAAVFGPQKGVTAERVAVHDARLTHWATLFPDVDPTTPGAGAAGGTGFGLLAWGATIVPGADSVARAIGLPDRLPGAALVITGEGRFDAQSAAGKVPSLVGALAAGDGVPVALVAGAIEASPDGFVDSVSLTELAGSSARAMASPVEFLRDAGARLARGFRG